MLKVQLFSSKIPLFLILFFVSLIIGTTSISAHVVVRPNQVAPGAFQTFTIGVPTEKDSATTEVRLVIPEGLQRVTPNLKPGWTIDLKNEGQGENQKITEIVWSNGRIPAKFRDEFSFSAKAPDTESTLKWKVYQTFADGSINAWDKDPKDLEKAQIEHPNHDFSAGGPLSQTKVVKEQKTNAVSQQAKTIQKAANTRKIDNAFLLGILAVILSAAALGMQLTKKHK